MIETGAEALHTGCWVLLGKEARMLSDKCFKNSLQTMMLTMEARLLVAAREQGSPCLVSIQRCAQFENV